MPPRRGSGDGHVAAGAADPLAVPQAAPVMPALPVQPAAAALPVPAAPQPTTPVTGTPSRGTLSRLIPKPDKFGGRGDVILFVYSLVNYFALVALVDAVEMGEDVKLLLTGTFLSDTALTWYRAHVAKYRLFSQLCDGLIKQFGDPNLEGTARAKLERLKQTGSVASYIQIFQEIGLCLSTQDVDFFETHEAHHAFTRGLLPEIRTAVAMSQKGSKNCREAILLASEYDGARRMGGASTSRDADRTPEKDRKVRFNDPMYGRFNNNNYNKGSDTRFNNSNQRPGSNAKSGARVNRAESAEPPARVCWNCGDPDHFANSCPKPPKNARMAAQRRK